MQNHLLEPILRKLSLALLLLLGACDDAGFRLLNLPTFWSHESIIHDVSYGANPGNKLDIYIPNKKLSGPYGVIVFFYSGRWTNGSKQDYGFVGATLAKQGFIVVIPDYRKYPNVHFPVFVQDGAKAVAWVYDNITLYNGDKSKINITGHSAGAHIGALLTTDTHYLVDEGKDRTTVIHRFVGLAGPYDFTPDEPDLMDMFSPPTMYPQMQATTFVDGQQPPMLLLHGADDTTVKRINLDKLQSRIVNKGGMVRSIIYPDTDHTDILLGLSWLKANKAPVVNDMVDFFNDRTVTQAK
jgi:dienelactone hydrolase